MSNIPKRILLTILAIIMVVFQATDHTYLAVFSGVVFLAVIFTPILENRGEKH